MSSETKATSQHQITIPKPIWEQGHFKPGLRFKLELKEDRTILLMPQDTDLDLTDEEWDRLVSLAHDKRNVSKQFSNVRSARAHLKKL